MMSAIGTKRTFRQLRCTCPLLGVKRTCHFALQMSAFDPKRTFLENVCVLRLDHDTVVTIVLDLFDTSLLVGRVRGRECYVVV